MMKKCKLFLIETMHKMVHNISKREKNGRQSYPVVKTVLHCAFTVKALKNLYLKAMQMPKHRTLGLRGIFLKGILRPLQKGRQKRYKKSERVMETSFSVSSSNSPLCNGYIYVSGEFF